MSRRERREEKRRAAKQVAEVLEEQSPPVQTSLQASKAITIPPKTDFNFVMAILRCGIDLSLSPLLDWFENYGKEEVAAIKECKRLLCVSLLIVAASTAVITRKLFPGDLKPSDISTTLRLKFSGRLEVPEMVHRDNIEYFYALWTPSAIVSSNSYGITSVPEHWVVVIEFTKPVDYSQPMVTFSNDQFPQYEVKALTPRMAIISVAGHIPGGFFDFYAKRF